MGAKDVIARLGPKFRQIQGGTVVPLAPPPIVGLGTGGGFTYVLQDLRGGDPKELAQVVRGLSVAANQDPRLLRVFSTFSATNPSIFLDIDRDKVQILGVQLSDVFQALQASLGGYFVNDMNLFGRTWQVQVQAEAADRRASTTSSGSMCATRKARWSRCAALRKSVSWSALPRSSATTTFAGHDSGRPGRRRVFRPGAGSDGRSRGENAAAGLSSGEWTDISVPGKTRRRKDSDHSRLRRIVCLPVPCRPL